LANTTDYIGVPGYGIGVIGGAGEAFGIILSPYGK
jgi:hypothetical protein